MENNIDPANYKKTVNKAKSHSSGPVKKLKSEPVKRKSFNIDEAVRSLDLAVGRLKKSKLVHELTANRNNDYSSISSGTANMFIDSVTNPSMSFIDVDNASLISMNFSHYELMRNLSLSNCNSEEAFSSTYGGFSSLTDIASRDEKLERYFRSVEMWGRGSKNGTK